MQAQLHRRLAIGHPLLRLAQIRVPVYQALLGAAAVFLLLVATEHPSPAKTLRALPTPLVQPIPTPPDSYEVTANVHLLEHQRRGQANAKDSLLIRFPTSVGSI